MNSDWTESGGAAEHDRRLSTLEQLLQIEATQFREVLTQAAQLVAEALGAEKVDAFILEPASTTLVAVGVSDTPLGQRQVALGLNRLPLANGGRVVEVFQLGHSYRTGRADQDPDELRGIKEALGVRSTITTPLPVGGSVRGVLQASSTRADAFAERDLHFLEAVARWVGIVAHRAELVEQIAVEAADRGRRTVAEELITVLAHDLRNYLTPLKGRIDLIHRRARREQRQDYLVDAEELQHTLARLNRLITDLLDVGRLEQGLFAVSPQPMDLVGLVQETAARFRSPETEIRLGAPDELVVCADPDRLRQALENLLANAVRYSPPGAAVELSVGVEEQVDEHWAVVTVSDQGPGIPPEMLPRLFTRFAIGPGSTGLGLGLYLAHSIATAHGGSLTVESSPGTGTRFRLALPVDRQLPLSR
jgi:two-component system, OmpR family, sensor kinase